MKFFCKNAVIFTALHVPPGSFSLTPWVSMDLRLGTPELGPYSINFSWTLFFWCFRKCKRTEISEKLPLRQLKPGAVPSIFQNAPSYCGKMLPPKRSAATSSSSRLDSENKKLENLANCLMTTDSVENLSLQEILCNCIARNLARKITHDNDKSRGMKCSKVVAKLQGILKR